MMIWGGASRLYGAFKRLVKCTRSQCRLASILLTEKLNTLLSKSQLAVISG